MKQIHIIYLVIIGLIQVSLQVVLNFCTPWRKHRAFPYKYTAPVKILEESIHEGYRAKYIGAYINHYNRLGGKI